MPRMLARAGILVALFAPALAFAAFDDVTLTTDTVLSVAGITLNVSGSSATIESITVNASNFSVTLQSGSSFQVTAPNLNRLSADTLTSISTDTCNATESVLKYNAGPAVTVTITPSSTLCSTNTSSGGGGGGSTTTATPAVVAAPATPAVTPAVPATPLWPSARTLYAQAGRGRTARGSTTASVNRSTGS